MLELTHNHGRAEPYDKGDGYAHVAFTVDGPEDDEKSQPIEALVSEVS